MTFTQEQLDALARIFQTGDTGDSDGWEDLAIDPAWMDIADKVAVTAETLDDFRTAAVEHWAESSAVQEIDGGLFWDRVQTAKGEPRVKLAVYDCGDFRIAYKA